MPEHPLCQGQFPARLLQPRVLTRSEAHDHRHESQRERGTRYGAIVAYLSQHGAAGTGGVSNVDIDGNNALQIKAIEVVISTFETLPLVEGKSIYTFTLPDGHQVKGEDLQQQRDWPWRASEQVPGVRYARLRAISPTYGVVTIIVVSEPREEQFYVMCLDTTISGPRLIRAWKRRHWIEYCFRTLKHLLATGACQVQSEEAYYGHVVLRLMGCLVLFYTSRVICKGRDRLMAQLIELTIFALILA